MSVRVEHGDCLEVMAALASQGEQYDACITDPPYHLNSIVKRFGKPGSAPARFDKTGGADRKKSRTGAYARHSTGFMGKEWDGGDIAFQPDTWALAFDLLKPGAHLLAFGLPKTFGRLQVAIEDAGFEIRDTIFWLFGSGFPKSHDVAKAIDKTLGKNGERSATAQPVRRIRPGADQHKDGTWEKLDDRTYEPHEYSPATDEAALWDGWGTALKPAAECIVLARKPLVGSVAKNVMEHGTGALNIDASRVPVSDDAYANNASGDRGHSDNRSRNMDFALGCGSAHKQGRWPANVVHDGSEEVLQAFPVAPGALRGVGAGFGDRTAVNTYGDYGPRPEMAPRGDAGLASRFFYCAKAHADDRLGSKHPTVKPVDLIAYLCRLVTPPGGTVLDPFAGSGTTGMACLREGFNAVLIEREAEYVADIEARLDHVNGTDTPLFSDGEAL